MNSEKLANWIQVATSIAVLVGLGLVVAEIRQTHRLTRTEMGSAGFDLLFERWRSHIGENFAVARTKACVAPDELTDVELTELRHYYLVTFASINRQRVLRQLGGFDDYDWQDAAEYEFRDIFREQPARAWFEASRDMLNGVSAGIVAIGDEIMRETTADCLARFMEFSDGARKAATHPGRTD
jgi:hypothetical protein